MRIAPKNTVNSATLDAHHPKQDAPPPLQIAHPSSKGVHFLSLRGTVPRPSVPRPTGYTAASQPTGVHCPSIRGTLPLQRPSDRNRGTFCPRFGVHCPSRAFRPKSGYVLQPNRHTFSRAGVPEKSAYVWHTNRSILLLEGTFGTGYTPSEIGAYTSSGIIKEWVGVGHPLFSSPQAF